MSNPTSIKDQLLALVRAYNKLVTTPTDNTAALVAAQAEAKAAVEALAAYKAGEALTAAEATELQNALNTAAATDPPEPAVVAEVTPALLGPPITPSTPPGTMPPGITGATGATAGR